MRLPRRKPLHVDFYAEIPAFSRRQLTAGTGEMMSSRPQRRSGYHFGCTRGVAGRFPLSPVSSLQRFNGDLAATHGLRIVRQRHRGVA